MTRRCGRVGGVRAEPPVAPDQGRITVFLGSTSGQRPRQVNFFVQVRHEVTKAVLLEPEGPLWKTADRESPSMVLALYPGSFDPVTFGHLDLIERATCAFADLKVVVANNPAKHYVFTLGSVTSLAEALRVQVRQTQRRRIGANEQPSAVLLLSTVFFCS